VQPMYRCLNEETADSPQATSKLAHGTVYSPPQQASTSPLVLDPHRSAAPMQPMFGFLTEEAADSTQAATKLARGTIYSPPRQAPTAALAVASAPHHPQRYPSKWITISPRRPPVHHKLSSSLPMTLRARHHRERRLLLLP
jgi:hypothetical protein